MGALVVARVGKRDRERPELVIGLRLGKGGDQARVEATGEIGANGNVGSQAQPDAVAQEIVEIGVIASVLPVLRGPPSALLDDPAAFPDDQPAGQHLADAAKHRARRPWAPEREHLVDSREIGCWGHLPGGEERLGLGAEDQGAVVPQRVEERAHAEAIPDQRQAPRARLPPGERELPVEPVERRDALALQHPQHDLGVAGRREALPAPAQLGPQLRVVVHLAVVDQQAASGTGLERLPAAGQVEDGQPGRDQAGAGVEGEPEAVRAAVADGAGHSQQRPLVDRRRGFRPHDACHAAHGQSAGSTIVAGACRYSVATRRRSISR